MRPAGANSPRSGGLAIPKNEAGPLRVLTVQAGTRYPDLYVDRLQRMVARHLGVPHRFICYTDRPVAGRFAPEVELGDLAGWRLPGYFNKLRLFDRETTGHTPFLFLDLTLVIRASMAPLLAFAQEATVGDGSAADGESGPGAGPGSDRKVGSGGEVGSQASAGRSAHVAREGSARGGEAPGDGEPARREPGGGEPVRGEPGGGVSLVGVADWNYPVLNSSVLWVRPDARTQQVWDDWVRGVPYLAQVPGDQNWIDAVFKARFPEALTFWPAGLVASYKGLRKQAARDPAGAAAAADRAVILKFHGQPRPHEVLRAWEHPASTILRHPLRPRLWRYLADEIRTHWW